jgi:glycosyltransferase involved in cell wall biosynthesis
MAFGLPVLALARGGMTEIIEDGRNGVLVQEAAAASLAQAAARMLRDQELRSRLSRAAREMVVSHYSADRMIDATAGILEEVISARATGQ